MVSLEKNLCKLGRKKERPKLWILRGLGRREKRMLGSIARGSRWYLRNAGIEYKLI